MVLIVIIAVVYFISSLSGNSTESTNTPKEVVYNSSWDASVRQVEQYLKDNLKDPGSYEGIEWSKVTKLDNGNFMVRHKYRAKNSFGGYVVDNKIFILSPTGVIQSVVDYE